LVPESISLNIDQTREEPEKMKKRLIVLGIAALVFGGVWSASATLVDNGNGVIWDDSSNLYWMQDLSIFANQDYSTQLSNISTYGGSTGADWYMASGLEISTLWSYSKEEITSMFTPTYMSGVPSNERTYYKGRYNEEDILSVGHLVASIEGGIGRLIKSNLGVSGRGYFDNVTYSSIGAWVVYEGSNPSPTPEPATMLLFGTGLAGLVGSRIRKKKKQQ
jgi:PEP-CTERM motif